MPEMQLTPDEIHAAHTERPLFLTLGDQLALEIRRNLDLIERYVRMPYEPDASPHQAAQPRVATGPAVAMLKRDVVEAVIATARGDTLAMIVSYRALKGNQ